MIQRLRLHAAEHRRTTALPAVAVRHLTDDVFVTALAVGEDGAQIALRASGHKQRGVEPQQGSDFVLQGVHAGVVGKHVIAQRGGQHRRAHGGGGLRDGVTAQVDLHCTGFMHNFDLPPFSNIR